MFNDHKISKARAVIFSPGFLTLAIQPIFLLIIFMLELTNQISPKKNKELYLVLQERFLQAFSFLCSVGFSTFVDFRQGHADIKDIVAFKKTISDPVKLRALINKLQEDDKQTGETKSAKLKVSGAKAQNLCAEDTVNSQESGVSQLTDEEMPSAECNEVVSLIDRLDVNSADSIDQHGKRIKLCLFFGTVATVVYGLHLLDKWTSVFRDFSGVAAVFYPASVFLILLDIGFAILNKLMLDSLSSSISKVEGHATGFLHRQITHRRRFSSSVSIMTTSSQAISTPDRRETFEIANAAIFPSRMTVSSSAYLAKTPEESKSLELTLKVQQSFFKNTLRESLRNSFSGFYARRVGFIDEEVPSGDRGQNVQSKGAVNL